VPLALLVDLLEARENLRFEALHDHFVGLFDLPFCAGVSHDNPIYMDVVFIAEL
jgi:hypothetical protein